MTEDQIKLLREHLTKGTAVVTFKKANGEIRDMHCTLLESLLPETTGAERKPNKDVMVVFDLEKEAWRSFRFDTVQKIHLFVE